MSCDRLSFGTDDSKDYTYPVNNLDGLSSLRWLHNSIILFDKNGNMSRVQSEILSNSDMVRCLFLDNVVQIENIEELVPNHIHQHTLK